MKDFGTWHVGCGNGEGSVFADGEGRMRMGPNGTTLTAICTVHDFDGERDDHARLIAAAPELLVALRECITEEGAACMNTGQKSRRLDAISRIARNAISKATGETP